MALWKSNVIVVGLTTIAAGLAGVIAKTWAWVVSLTVAKQALVATGIGLFVIAIGAIASAVYSLYQRWTDNSAAIAASASRVDTLKDKMEQVVESAKRINDSMRSTLNELMSPLEKYKNKLGEIKTAGEQKITLAADMKDVSFEMQDIALKMSKTKDESAIAAYSGQISELQKQFKALKEQQKISASFSDADIAAAKAKALEDYRSSLGIVKSDAENLAEQTKKLTEGMNAGAINQTEFNSLLKAAKEKYDPIVKAEVESIKMLDEEMQKELAAAEELAKMESDARKQLADSFRSMVPKSPQKAFDDLSAQLNSIKDLLSPAEFAAAKQKLFDDMAAGMGIAEFVNPKQAATFESMQSKVIEYYNKLDALGKATFDLTAAQKRVTESFEKQSGFYNDYQKMLDNMKSPVQKMKEYADALTADAKKFGWDNAVIQKMLDVQKKQLNTENKKETKAKEAANNSATVRGTTAYYEAQNKANQPMLAESKKQTAIMNKIAENTKPKPVETPFEVQAV